MPTTGLPTADAQDDFLRARRRRTLSRIATALRRDPGDIDVIVPFDEVVAALGRVGERDLGVRPIPLDSVVGTVDRGRDFDRAFRPTSPRVRPRWERIALARRRGESFPPIDVFRVGEAHFVRDGHHRVSVARAQGDDTIDARVVEVLTRVGADRGLRVTRPAREGPGLALPRAVPLPPDARVRITLSDPWRFGMLAEGVEAWGFRLMHRDVVLLDREEVARRWYAEEYRPVVALLREATLFDPRRETEADAYLRLSAERYRLMRTQAWSDEVIERLRRG
ncbi:MAG: chromosome partitioning protein ParB [Actinomycetota bacterium]|nr:chromosome partitioning protein ParB [Actinomycetota bacterium]